MLFCFRQITGNHFGTHLFNCNLWFPTQYFFRFCWITKKSFNFCRTEITRINTNDHIPNTNTNSTVRCFIDNSCYFINTLSGEF